MTGEINPFPFFLPTGANKLIVGSFPCPNGSDYGDWFYSGSGRNHFWQLLSDTFSMPADFFEQKRRLCEKHHIALTDIGYRIERLRGNCSDANLRILEFNRAGIDACLKAGIKKIFFTSRFVERHFLHQYPDLEIPQEVLISPSPSANRHIGGLSSYKELIASETIRSPYDYRLLHYRKLLLE